MPEAVRHRSEEFGVQRGDNTRDVVNGGVRDGCAWTSTATARAPQEEAEERQVHQLGAAPLHSGNLNQSICPAPRLSPGARTPGSAISVTLPRAGAACVCVLGGGERILMSFNSLPKFPNYLGSSARREETHQAVAPSRLTPRAGSGGCTSRDRPLPRRRRRGWRRACVSCSPPAIGARSPPSVWG